MTTTSEEKNASDHDDDTNLQHTQRGLEKTEHCRTSMREVTCSLNPLHQNSPLPAAHPPATAATAPTVVDAFTILLSSSSLNSGRKSSSLNTSSHSSQQGRRRRAATSSKNNERNSRPPPPPRTDRKRPFLAATGSSSTTGLNHTEISNPPAKSTNIYFVVCPVGCGQHIMMSKMNDHIDQCLVRMQKQHQQQQLQEQKNKKDSNNNQEIPTVTPEKLVLAESGLLLPIEIDEHRAAKPTTHPSNTTIRTESSTIHSISSACRSNRAMATVNDHNHHDDHPAVEGGVGIASSPSCDTDINRNAPTSPLKDDHTKCNGNHNHPSKENIKKVVNETHPKSPEMNLTIDQPVVRGNGDNASSNLPNAFTVMLSQSRTAFRSSKEAKLCIQKQYFHLHATNGYTVSLSTTPPLTRNANPVVWSAVSTVRTNATRDIKQSSQSRTVTEIHISSSIISSRDHHAMQPHLPSHHQPLPSTVAASTTATTADKRRLVRDHSRFSIAVLKSILQKSIRRRKPLPSVRVAMELADRSMDDLIRRLPIIILEDSTLHPDFGLLVWLMMAHSKGYEIPDPLVDRVLQIVYEIASCPWQDRGPDPHNAHHTDRDIDERFQSTLSLSGLVAAVENPWDVNTSGLGYLNETDAILAWSMLVRAEYGGMSCDVQMLREYATRWVRRWQLPEANDLAARNTDTMQGVITWSEVPRRLHQRANEQSQEHLSPLLTTGIEFLTRGDVCSEGVDYHCSNVLDHLLDEESFVGLSLDLLTWHIKNNDGDDGSDRDQTIPPLTGDRRSWLLGILKDCMWTYSSGVNHRRPLIGSSSNKQSQDTTSAIITVPAETFIASPQTSPNLLHQELWTGLALPRVRAWQEKFIQQRLAVRINERF